MKVLIEYDKTTGQVTDSEGLYVGSLLDLKGYVGSLLNLKGFENKSDSVVLELIKQGVTPDEIIKLKKNDLL